MKFSNRKAGNFGNKGDFDTGLDDLDDEGNVKNKAKQSQNQGCKEFRNLGSTARGAQREDRGDARQARRSGSAR